MPERKRLPVSKAGLDRDYKRPLPDLPETNASGVLAVCFSDCQFEHTPPVARSKEANWYGVMEHYIWQLASLCRKHSCPAICAGDLLDHWNSPPELVNFLIAKLNQFDEFYAVPGNHDLPHHDYKELHRSAYWTLVESGAIKDLPAGCPVYSKNKKLVLYGFPWGFEARSPKERFDEDTTTVAVVHDYCWKIGKGHHGSPPDKHWQVHAERLKGFDAVVMGDNHSGFLAGKVLNCGTLLRRTVGEIDYHPRVGLLYAGGRIERIRLDTSKDVISADHKVKAKPIDIRGLAEELESERTEVDFVQALEHRARKESEGVQEVITSVVEVTRSK